MGGSSSSRAKRRGPSPAGAPGQWEPASGLRKRTQSGALAGPSPGSECGPQSHTHTHMVAERKAIRAREHAGWGHGAAGSREVPRAGETKGGRGWGQDINGGHQMQTEGGEGERHTELLRHPTQLALVGPSGAAVQTNPHGQKRPDSHSNSRKDLILIQMSFHPSPERLFSRSLWGMCPPPHQPQTLPFRLGSQ